MTGFTTQRLNLGHPQENLMCKLTLEVMFYGLAALLAMAAPRLVNSKYVSFSTFFNSILIHFSSWSWFYLYDEVHLYDLLFCLFQIELSFFDPRVSSSASLVSCSDQRCYSNFQTESGCSPNNLCSYSFKYGDGSGTSGYYISDFMSFDTVITSTLAINSSAPFVFG